MDYQSGRFYFDGGAGSYLITGVFAAFITICTFGIGFPFALVVLERWRVKHTYIDGQRLMFSGTGMGLFVLMIKLCFMCFITFGIYSLWVVPNIQEWKVEHTDFDPTWQPKTLG